MTNVTGNIRPMFGNRGGADVRECNRGLLCLYAKHSLRGYGSSPRYSLTCPLP